MYVLLALHVRNVGIPRTPDWHSAYALNKEARDAREHEKPREKPRAPVDLNLKTGNQEAYLLCQRFYEAIPIATRVQGVPIYSDFNLDQGAVHVRTAGAVAVDSRANSSPSLPLKR